MRTRNTLCPFCRYPDFSLVDYSCKTDEFSALDELIVIANVVCLGCNAIYDIALYPYTVMPPAYEGIARNAPTRQPSKEDNPKPRLHIVK